MKRRLSTALALSVGLGLLPGGPARADSTFTFFGSGWGHGIGLSQYGAYGLAQRGWGAIEIVSHYYRGVSIASRPPPAPAFRIGLLQSRRSVTLTAEAGSLRLALSGGRRLASVPPGGTRRVVVAGGRYRVLRSDGRAAGGGGSATEHLVVRRGRGAVVRVAEWGHALGRGRLEFTIAGADRAHLVAVLAPEAYLLGVAEVPSSWPEAALQAQAIAARTYAYRTVAEDPGQRRRGCACGLFADTRDQFYAGWTKERGASWQRWAAAVAATAGTIATYGDDPIHTYYSSSSGGFTENVENVWAGAKPAPYLKGVCDPGDYLRSNPNRTWSISLSSSEVTRRLRALTGPIGTVTGFTDYVGGVSGRVRALTVTGTAGSATVRGWDLRRALGLKDTRFRVNRNLNVTGRIREAYDGLMCGPGIATEPQATVDGGRYQDFESGRMYLHGARDVVVWLRGPVWERYRAVGAHASVLGLPLQLEETPDGGWVGRFDGGSITCPPGGACTEGYGPS